MTLPTRLTALLGIRHPVIQAPMAGVDTPALAAAVSNAGGLGSIALGAISAEAARHRIRATRALTRRPFAVNVFVHDTPVPDATRERAWLECVAPHLRARGSIVPAALSTPFASFNDDDAKLDVLLAEQPAVVSFHFGLPEPQRAAALRHQGAVLVACATSVAEAERAAAAGMDAIIAQGVEAGGHRGSFIKPFTQGEIGTIALVPQIVDAVDCPVIAAGGIADGRGIAAALALGASGVQLGTAFVTCAESAARPAHRQMIGSVRAGDTRITRVLTGRPARGIPNRLQCALEPYAEGVPDYPIAYAVGRLIAAGETAGRGTDPGFSWAGQAAPLNRTRAAAALVDTLLAETARELERLERLRR